MIYKIGHILFILVLLVGIIFLCLFSPQVNEANTNCQQHPNLAACQRLATQMAEPGLQQFWNLSLKMFELRQKWAKNTP